MHCFHCKWVSGLKLKQLLSIFPSKCQLQSKDCQRSRNPQVNSLMCLWFQSFLQQWKFYHFCQVILGFSRYFLSQKFVYLNIELSFEIVLVYIANFALNKCNKIAFALISSISWGFLTVIRFLVENLWTENEIVDITVMIGMQIERLRERELNSLDPFHTSALSQLLRKYVPYARH